MVSSSSEGRASKMSIVRRRSVTRMLAVAPGLPIGGGQVWFTSNNANRGRQVPGAFERISILRVLWCQIWLMWHALGAKGLRPGRVGGPPDRAEPDMAALARAWREGALSGPFTPRLSL